MDDSDRSHRQILALRLRESRRASALTQAALADEIGVPRTTVANWEQGVAVPPLDLLGRIAEALGLQLSDLLAPAMTAEREAPLRAQLGRPQEAPRSEHQLSAVGDDGSHRPRPRRRTLVGSPIANMRISMALDDRPEPEFQSARRDLLRYWSVLDLLNPSLADHVTLTPGVARALCACITPGFSSSVVRPSDARRLAAEWSERPPVPEGEPARHYLGEIAKRGVLAALLWIDAMERAEAAGSAATVRIPVLLSYLGSVGERGRRQV